MKMSKLAVKGAGRSAYIGPLQEEEIGGRLAFRKIPSEAWFAAHPDGAEEPPTDDEFVVQCVVMGIHRWPSRLKHPSQWDEAQFPIVELSVTPYVEWMRAAKAALARKKGEPVENGESEIDTASDPPVIESSLEVPAIEAVRAERDDARVDEDRPPAVEIPPLDIRPVQVGTSPPGTIVHRLDTRPDDDAKTPTIEPLYEPEGE